MKELGEIVGYIFTPSEEQEAEMMALYRLIRIKGIEGEREYMESFSIEQYQEISRMKDKLVHNHPEPLQPYTSWIEYIEGL